MSVYRLFMLFWGVESEREESCLMMYCLRVWLEDLVGLEGLGDLFGDIFWSWWDFIVGLFVWFIKIDEKGR